ncbi:iron reductase domain protein [Hyaloscypha variabilis F]|uniref:Iron reductase domain protein n=1 Tax=Hyaloscypha variabilis (strain UAMH 11265 / GT02V1 / F) TaxID=1149755 RepID=A0A2J6QTP0_HYAVF|nr:iron reductase domain protein [Hyaloscypha variabilis F]
MKNFKCALGVVCVGLATQTNAALATFSPGPSYSVGIPSSSTISQTSEGGIYFQLSAPTSFQWVGLGIGSQMAGATIFVMYANGEGNVTISARDGDQGHVEPVPDSTLQSGVTLLAGSGIVDGQMIANVYCTTCKLDSSKSSTTSPWICAWNVGSALNSASVSATITQHQEDNTRQFEFDLTAAVLSSDSNPFVSSSVSSASGTKTGSSSSPTTTTINSGSGDGAGNTGATVVGPSFKVITDYQTAHGVIMGSTMVLLLPLGAMFMRLGASVYLHGAWQLFALCAMLCGFGLGIKLAQMRSLLYNTTHTIFGTVIIGLFLLQPIFGLLHHLQFRKHQSRAPVSHLHIWYGRALISCGIVNGGLGLQLAENSKGGMIGYGVVAGVVGLLYLLLVVFKRKGVKGVDDVGRQRRVGGRRKREGAENVRYG